MGSLSNTNRRQQPKQLSNLTVRTLTALAIVPVALIGVVVGGGLWALLLTPVAAVGALELIEIATRDRGPLDGLAVMLAAWFVVVGGLLGQVLLWAVVPVLLVMAALLASRDDLRRRLAAMTFALLYVAMPLALLSVLRDTPDGLLYVAMILAATWGTDTCAYFTGIAVGRTPFFPAISPKKTLEGAVGGMIGGGLGLLVIWLVFGGGLSAEVVVLALLAPLATIGGDLFESALKRHYHVKDSHPAGFNLIPGHGGVLDRIDGLIVVTVLFCVVLLFSGVI